MNSKSSSRDKPSPTSAPTPRIGSLFTGTGALDLGVIAATGGHLVWYAEADPKAARILSHHHPTIANLGDLTWVDWTKVEPVDILVGGTPCQDVSNAGQRQGMRQGTRSNLWVIMRDAISFLHPDLVIWENVRGVTTAPAATALEPCPRCVGTPDEHSRATSLRALGRVLGDLADLRYDAEWVCLPASAVGAPHLRHRIFVAAHPQSL